jgi:hypothetical protein
VTIDEAIRELEELREMYGGHVPLRCEGKHIRFVMRPMNNRYVQVVTLKEGAIIEWVPLAQSVKPSEPKTRRTKAKSTAR